MILSRETVNQGLAELSQRKDTEEVKANEWAYCIIQAN